MYLRVSDVPTTPGKRRVETFLEAAPTGQAPPQRGLGQVCQRNGGRRQEGLQVPSGGNLQSAQPPGADLTPGTGAWPTHRVLGMLLMAPRDAFSLEGVTWDGHVDCTRLQQELRKRATGELPRRSLAGRAVGPYAHACLPRLAKCLVDGLIKRQCPPCRLCGGEGL